MFQRTLRLTASWLGSLLAIASLMVAGRSEALAVNTTGTDDGGLAISDQEVAGITYAEVGDADSEEDDNPPRPE